MGVIRFTYLCLWVYMYVALWLTNDWSSGHYKVIFHTMKTFNAIVKIYVAILFRVVNVLCVHLVIQRTTKFSFPTIFRVLLTHIYSQKLIKYVKEYIILSFRTVAVYLWVISLMRGLCLWLRCSYTEIIWKIFHRWTDLH